MLYAQGCSVVIYVITLDSVWKKTKTGIKLVCYARFGNG